MRAHARARQTHSKHTANTQQTQTRHKHTQAHKHKHTGARAPEARTQAYAHAHACGRVCHLHLSSRIASPAVGGIQAVESQTVSGRRSVTTHSASPTRDGEGVP